MLSNLPKTTPEPVNAVYRQLFEQSIATRFDLATYKDVVAANNGAYDSVIYYSIKRRDYPNEFKIIDHFNDNVVMKLDGTGTDQKANPQKLEEQKETVDKNTLDNSGLANIAKGLGGLLLVLALYFLVVNLNKKK